MKLNELDIAFFGQLREGMKNKGATAPMKTKLPPTLAELIRLQAPELVRQDAEKPGMPKLQIIIDDGPNAGLLIATCASESDAKMIVAMWNWIRQLKSI